MKYDERLKNLPAWIRRAVRFVKKLRLPAKVVYIIMSLLATTWFLVRVFPKPSRAAYPCMRVAAPVMSGFVVWLLSLAGTAIGFRKARLAFAGSKKIVAFAFLFVGIISAGIFLTRTAKDTRASDFEVWYKANTPLGVARGIHPGRVAWGHNSEIAKWDGKTGSWWEDRFNDQAGTDKLFEQTICTLTGEKNARKSWDALFRSFNQSKRKVKRGYRAGEKVTVKVNLNNTYSHESNNEINANPQLIFSMLKSLVKDAGVPQEDITIADPSRFITDNIFDKCHAVFPGVHYVDHDGGDGREKAIFVENAIPYSVDNGKVATGLASCMLNADYIIDMALMKGHVAQGVTLSAKNFFGCTSIESDWRKNAHSAGFSQDKNGRRTYSVYPDYLGHKDLGGKTILFLVDGIYSNKFVDKVPAFKWKLAPFNNNWPGSLFASQDGVAVDAVVLDFILTEWPDAPDLMYSDYYLEESALAGNPPSGTVYDPERDGSRLTSLGVTEHWNNPVDKQYSRNLGKNDGIELVYRNVGGK